MGQDDKYSAVIIGARSLEEGYLRDAISDLVRVVAGEPKPDAFHRVITEKHADIAILYLDTRPKDILFVTRGIAERRSCSVIVVSRENVPENVVAAMKAGADDFAFFDPADPTDLRRAVSSIRVQPHRSPSINRGKVVSFFSAKGGSGATTIACNLAVSLIRHGLSKVARSRKVALLDFDLELGDVVAFMDVTPGCSYLELLGNMHTMDEHGVYDGLALHSSGLQILAQTTRVDEAREITGIEMRELIDFLRQYFDFVLIDGIRDFRELNLVGLDLSDYVALNVTQEVLAFKNAKRCLQIFNLLGYDPDKIKLIINRYQPSRHMNDRTIADAMERPVDGTIRNHFPSVIHSINSGKLLVTDQPGAKVARDIVKLGSLFFEDPSRESGHFLAFRHRKHSA